MKLSNENIMHTVEEMEQFCGKHRVDKRQCKMISLEIKLVVSEYAVVIIIDVLLLYLFLHRRIRPKKFLSHVKPVLTVAFATASSTATMESNMKACNDMGVNTDLSKLWSPLAYGMLVREFDIVDLAASTSCIDMEKFNS